VRMRRHQSDAVSAPPAAAASSRNSATGRRAR
jgi:hypothetical protein